MCWDRSHKKRDCSQLSKRSNAVQGCHLSFFSGMFECHAGFFSVVADALGVVVQKVFHTYQETPRKCASMQRHSFKKAFKQIKEAFGLPLVVPLTDSLHDVIPDSIRRLQGWALGEVYLKTSIEIVCSLRTLFVIASLYPSLFWNSSPVHMSKLNDNN